MSKLNIIKNPSQEVLEELFKKVELDENIIKKIVNQNVRIELVENKKYLFMIFYIPEYRKEIKTIESVELNLLYLIDTNEAYLLANNTDYFFDKYREEVERIEFKTPGGFFEELMSLIIDDETRIIEHILTDTNKIKSEYFNNTDTYKLIRHLTNNLINISSINLITSNQNKLLSLFDEYITKVQKTKLNYKKTYLSEELEYAREFCNTLMHSINTKFEVRSSDDLYRFTKYSFVVFISSFFVALMTLLYEDNSRGNIFFITSILLTLLTLLAVIINFRKRN